MAKRKKKGPGSTLVRFHKVHTKADLQKLADKHMGGNLNKYLNLVLHKHIEKSLIP